jgi:hypothetical protein
MKRCARLRPSFVAANECRSGEAPNTRLKPSARFLWRPSVREGESNAPQLTHVSLGSMLDSTEENPL